MAGQNNHSSGFLLILPAAVSNPTTQERKRGSERGCDPLKVTQQNWVSTLGSMNLKSRASGIKSAVA